jgi:hypothetical protein
VKPRVAWLSFAPLRKTSAGWTSDVASARYRLTIPARALGELGFDSVVVDAGVLTDPSRLLKRVAQADAAIIGKLVAPPEQFVEQAPKILRFVQALSSGGVRVFADFSDDGFREPLRGPYFRGLANIADAVVASTEGLAAILREETAAAVHVVTDPVEGERREPAVREPGTARPLNLLWYGHPTNLDTLDLGIPQIAPLARRLPIAITLITAHDAGVEAGVVLAERLKMNCRFIPWSIGRVFGELRVCDAVVIPSDPLDRRRAIKSPNRFTEATWAGRFVVAHHLPAYEALAAYGWVGEDIGAGLEWMVQNPGEALDRIRAGQAAIDASFTPRAVARQWQAALASSLK